MYLGSPIKLPRFFLSNNVRLPFFILSEVAERTERG